MDHQQQVAQAVADGAMKVQLTASLGTVVGSVFQFINEYAAAFGLLVAFCGFLVSWYYQRKAYKLKAKKYEREGIVEDEE